jgi:hypothetical protein
MDWGKIQLAGQLPNFAGAMSESPGRYSAEFGLFYAISPAHQRHGYASEAAQALVDVYAHLTHSPTPQFCSRKSSAKGSTNRTPSITAPGLKSSVRTTDT